jgi:MFS family permease
VGIVLLAGAAFAVTWGLIHAGRTGWTDPAGAVALTAGAAAVGSFLLWQRRTDQPTIPLHLLRNPGFTAAATVLALSAATVSAATFLIAQYFQDGRGDSPLQAGLHMLPWTAAPLLIAPAAGRLSDHLGRRPVLVVGMLAQAGGLAWFALLTGPRHAEMPPAVPLLIAGLGISLVLPTATAGALDGLPPHHVGTAAGVTATTQRLGGVIGIAAAATVFAGHGDLHTPAAFAAGFRPALLLAAGFSVLGALTALARHARCEVGGDLAGAGALTPLAR